MRVAQLPLEELFPGEAARRALGIDKGRRRGRARGRKGPVAAGRGHAPRGGFTGGFGGHGSQSPTPPRRAMQAGLRTSHLGSQLRSSRVAVAWIMGWVAGEHEQGKLSLSVKLFGPSSSNSHA